MSYSRMWMGGSRDDAVGRESARKLAHSLLLLREFPDAVRHYRCENVLFEHIWYMSNIVVHFSTPAESRKAVIGRVLSRLVEQFP